MIGVVVVRGGQLPAGAEEVTAECGGRVVLVGDDVAVAEKDLRAATEVLLWEAGPFRPAAWAAALADTLAADDLVVLPASPDGRDFAPRLAAALGRSLVAGAVLVRPDRVVAARYDGRLGERVTVDRPLVVTLVPGVRGVAAATAPHQVRTLDLPLADPAEVNDAEVLAVLPADPATVTLTEADRIVSGGVGLGGAAAFEELAEVAGRLGASVGGTRVVADLGWIPFERQIGTTGMVVDPQLYLAFGISGAVQHTSGLGSPDHVIAVNVDASAPMMTMADVAIVSDAPAVLAELRSRLPDPRETA